MHVPLMRESNGAQTAARPTRSIWWIFSAAWLAYLGLFLSSTLLDGRMTRDNLSMALAGFLPPVLLSIPIVLRRRDLLRPERGIRRTLLLNGGMGAAYAVVSGGLGTLASVLVVGPDLLGTNVGMTLMGWSVSALFLYLIIVGTLMWTESLSRVQEIRALASREAMLRAQAEADALRAQFNPHFVFNTLHSLILLVHAEPATAERAIEDVAALIRYASTLQRRQVDLVPLEQEVSAARRYIGLEKLRLGPRLKISWGDITGLGQFGVPPLAVQTLLENAVKHGVSSRSVPGTVRFRAAREGESLVLMVEDDGPGADPTQHVGAQGRGLGLLQQRLAMLFRDAASLTWITAPGRGFRVTLRMPCMTPAPVTLPAWDAAAKPGVAET